MPAVQTNELGYVSFRAKTPAELEEKAKAVLEKFPALERLTEHDVKPMVLDDSKCVLKGYVYTTFRGPPDDCKQVHPFLESLEVTT